MTLMEKLKALLSEEETPVVALAADHEIEIDVARVGCFKDMTGKVVKITREILAELASSLDLTSYRPKIKKGHEKAGTTGEAAVGEVVGLRVVDDKLLAKLAFGKDVHDEIRNRKYTERSIEYDDRPGKRKFLGLALLGARDPAIAGLSPLVLSDGTRAPGTVVMLSEAPPIDDAAKVEEKNMTEKTTTEKTETVKKETPMPDDTKLQEETARREAAEKQAAADRAKLATYAREDVDRFLAADVTIQKVPLVTLQNPAFKSFLVALAGLETEAERLPEGSRVVQFASADGKTKEEKSLYAAAKAIFLAGPVKLSETEKGVIVDPAKAGADSAEGDGDLPRIAAFAGRDAESDNLHRRIVALQTQEKAAGRDLDYESAMAIIVGGQ